ncbi:hypothetical protein Leryth_011950 [Lithospermum erythrorhizon]|nr:hypothetical protein Leryth_011950 [Lithospermum erythrorhizon]
MSLLRLLPPPSTTANITNHPNQPPLFNPLHIVFPNKYFSFSLSCTPKKTNVFVLHASTSSLQDQETKEHEEKGEKGEEQEEECFNARVIARNVPWNCTADDIRPLFQKFGTVVDIELPMFSKTKNRGLAFVTMGSPEEALAALNGLESYEFEGRVLKLNFARPKKEKSVDSPQPKPMPVHNLFVANLPLRAREKDLTEFFNADKENVVSAEVIFHKNPRKSAGYGFVSFNTKAEAEAAIVAFQGKEFMGRPIRVSRSKRFLRNETKEAMQLSNTATEINPIQTSSNELAEA